MTDAPAHSPIPPEPMWRQYQCDCGQPYILAQTPRGRLLLVTAEPQSDGNLALSRIWGSNVPQAQTLTPARRFGKTQLRVKHTCRYADGNLRSKHGG